MPVALRLLLFLVLTVVLLILINEFRGDITEWLVSMVIGVAIAFAAAIYLLSGKGFR